MSLKRLARPRHRSGSCRVMRSPAPAAQEATDPGVAASAVKLTHEETDGEPGTEAEQSARQQLSTGVALNPSCDSELHSVNLIPSNTPENRAE